MSAALDRASNGAADGAPSSPSGVLVVIPCLNEQAHLPGLLAALCASPAADRILVVDGGSTDRSVEIARDAAARDPRVAVLDNPKRIQSAAVNLAAARYGADAAYLVRVDAHAGYPPDYVARLVEACETSGAEAVAVSMRAVGGEGACFQIAAAAAQNSVLGTGGSAHRSAGERRWVDHGHHALFRMASFRDAGGYDETFTHNEDAEFDARLIARGGRILLAADILIDYFPRASAGALWRQYFQFGRGRAKMLFRHRKIPKLRQAAPLAVAPAAALALFAPLSLWAAAPAAAWLLVCLGFGAAVGARQRSACAAFSGVAAAIMHLAWSSGFCAHVLLDARPASLRASAEGGAQGGA
jgi:succinoglycan biosynthesis protein ExoA